MTDDSPLDRLEKAATADTIAKLKAQEVLYDIIQVKSTGRIFKRRKKRKTKNMEKILSRNELLTMIEHIPADRARHKNKGLMYRALVAMLYLTGGRINEVLAIKKDQFEFADSNGIKYMIINNVLTLKRRERMYRPIFIRKDFEAAFIDYVTAWLKHVYWDDSPVFNISPSRAWRIVYEYTKLFPHFFRHMRNTDLTRYYGFSAHYLKLWNGWSQAKSADFYVQLVGEDLRSKILQMDKLNRAG